MVIEYAWKEGCRGYLDTLDINLVMIEINENNTRAPYFSMFGRDHYIRPYLGGYIKVNGVKLTDPDTIVDKLGEIMMLERGLGIPDEKPREACKRKTRAKTV